MTVCKKCGGTGEINVPVTEHLGTVLYGSEQCDECDGTGEVQTNEEWFDGLSTEEKAEVFANATYSSACLATEILFFGKEAEQKKWSKWLKQPHQKE